MSKSTDWLESHCFEFEPNKVFWFRDKVWSFVKFKALCFSPNNRWTMESEFDFEGQTYKFGMWMDEITDEKFREFVMRHNEMVKKLPCHYLSGYYIDYTNDVIT